VPPGGAFERLSFDGCGKAGLSAGRPSWIYLASAHLPDTFEALCVLFSHMRVAAIQAWQR